ncbi:MAG: hypothetical protein H0A75_01810, partial [Candidatus Methanofishera endochildressiae]|nr:hypothetical protein [Candidatus Methanofishera endochildressiae]
LAFKQQVAPRLKKQTRLVCNAISPDATEMSWFFPKKMLQSNIDDLAEPATPELATNEPQQTEELAAAAQTQIIEHTPNTAQDDDNSVIHALISRIQLDFSQRLERILASGGGLLVVVNQATATDKDLAEQLSTAEIPVVIIEARTLASLQRLGAASPVAHTEVLFEPESLVQQSLVDTQILFAQYG